MTTDDINTRISNIESKIEEIQNKIKSSTNSFEVWIKPRLDILSGYYQDIKCPNCGNPEWWLWVKPSVLEGYNNIYIYSCNECGRSIVVYRSYGDNPISNSEFNEKFTVINLSLCKARWDRHDRRR